MKEDRVMDMHIHTENSDGQYSVCEIVKKIEKLGIGVFSITDHDDITSCFQIQDLNLNDLEFYNGVEISSEYKNLGMHILGYDFLPTNEMMEMINKVKDSRKQRCLELIDMLYDEDKIFIPENMIDKVLDHKVVGRPHLVEVLYELGYGKNNKEIFDKYFKNYTSKTKYRINIEKVIETLKKANGIVVVAHPKEIEKHYHIDIADLLPDLVELGIDGIEIYNSIHSNADIKRYIELAQKYNLLVSGGSDYHGEFVKPNVELGKVTKEKEMVKSLSLVNELRRRKL